MAAVCRNWVGLYLGSSSITLNHMSEIPTLETLACREAQALASDVNIQRILIASDSATVIKDIAEGARGQNVTVIRELIARKDNFHACHFMYESRRTNFEADSLAKYYVSLDFGRHVWVLQPHGLVTISTHIVDQ